MIQPRARGELGVTARQGALLSRKNMVNIVTGETAVDLY